MTDSEQIWQLVCDNDQRVVTEGGEYKCLGAFHRVCPFSYSDHKRYSTTTYTIRRKKP